MTLTVNTRSHGYVDSGFYWNFFQLFRLGEYAFSTRHLCELVTELAKGASEGVLFSINPDTYWQQQKAYHQEQLKRLGEKSLDEFIQQQQEGKSADSLYSCGEKVSVTITVDAAIGKYILSQWDFTFMAVYAALGGWGGWDETPPVFAEITKEALVTPTNRFFQDAPKIAEVLTAKRRLMNAFLAKQRQPV